MSPVAQQRVARNASCYQYRTIYMQRLANCTQGLQNDTDTSTNINGKNNNIPDPQQQQDN
eukprot:scaffold454227_cov29-Prasinocladus_malaysianus.AAC.1